MDWLHCNHCYVLGCDAPDNVKFFVSNCGQVLCSRCTDGTIQKCLFHDHDSSYTPMSALRQEHEALFSDDVIQIIQKNLKYLDFKINQKALLFNYYKAKTARYLALKQENATLKAECRRHRDEKNNLKSELIQKFEELKKVKKELEQRQQRVGATSHVSSGYFSDPQTERMNYLFGSAAPNNQLSFSPIADQSSSSVFTPPQMISRPDLYRVNKPYSFSTPQTTMTFKSPTTSDYTPQRSNSRLVTLPGDVSPVRRTRVGLQKLHLRGSSVERASQGSLEKNPRRPGARFAGYGQSKFSSYM